MLLKFHRNLVHGNALGLCNLNLSWWSLCPQGKGKNGLVTVRCLSSGCSLQANIPGLRVMRGCPAVTIPGKCMTGPVIHRTFRATNSYSHHQYSTNIHQLPLRKTVTPQEICCDKICTNLWISSHVRLLCSGSSPGSNDDILDIANDPEMKSILNDLAKDFADDQDQNSDSQNVGQALNEESDLTSSDSESDSSDDSSDSDSDTEVASRPSDTEATQKSDASSSFPSDTGLHKSIDSYDINSDIGRIMAKQEYEEFEEFDDNEETDYVEIVEEEPLPVSLHRGTTGVYDIEDLVAVLKDENARDLCVINVPKEHNYVDFMVVVTGRSTRHIKAIAERVRWIYKRRRGKRDPETVKIEGEVTNDWMALDLGNIALHLFLQETREKYDLETLWTVGPMFDEKMAVEEDPFAVSLNQTVWTLQAQEELIMNAPQDKPITEPYPISENSPVFEGMENVAGWHQKTDPGESDHRTNK